MVKISSAKSSSAPADEARPYPPRYFWLRRLSSAGVLLLLGIVGLRAWWGHVSQSRMNAFIASVQARHEPILADDFDTPEIPANDNAADVYAKAANSLRFSQAEGNFLPTNPYSPADVQFAAGMMTAHAREIQLVRSARSRHHVEWGHPQLGSPAFTYGKGRNLALLMSYVVACEHAQGDDAHRV